MKLSKSILRIAYVALALVYFASCSSSGSSSSTPANNFGSIQIAFTATVTSSGGVMLPLKNVLLNVANVRVNTTANASPGLTNWRAIPFPDEPPADSPPGAFQMDLNSVAGLPVVYNTTQIITANYQSLQIQLDPSPGAIVPLCPNPATDLEGCIMYPIEITSTIPSNLIVQLNPTAEVETTHPVPVVINLNFDITAAPTTTGGAYMVSLTATQVQNPVSVGGPEGMVTATVKGNSTVTGGAVQTLTAFVAGTDTFITSIPIGSNNTFMLPLPATNVGTLYDLVVSGNDATYSAIRLPPLMPGATFTPEFTVVSGQTVGSMAGLVVDACTAAPIEGATVQLLVPPAAQPSPAPITNQTCKDPTTSGECIAAVTTTTDITGQYPVINAVGNPTGTFAEIPILPFPSSSSGLFGPYIIGVSAPGYTTLYAQGSSNSSTSDQAGSCIQPGSTTRGACNFSLQSNLVSGTVALTSAPAPGQNVTVTVFAETSGTTNLVANSAPLLFTSSTPTSQAFTMHVPTKSTLEPALDFFAEATDTFQGAADPYTAHTIDVRFSVPTNPFDSSCPPASPIGGDPTYATFTLDCTGHSSVTGSLADANNLTSAVLSQTGVSPSPAPTTGQVQLFTGNAIPSGGPTPSSWSYAICAPAGNYVATQYQVSPVPNVTPSATPVPSPVSSATAALPTASPTSTGCPTTCLNTDGSCPGNCMGATVNLGVSP